MFLYNASSVFLLLCCLILLFPGCKRPDQRTDVIALKGFQILTLEDEKVTKGMVLILKDELILEYITEGNFSENYNLPDSLIVNGQGKYLMPSFNEMHAHLQPNNPNHKRYLSHYLGYGITNIRVMAGNEQLLIWKDKIEKGQMLGPDLKVAGPLIDGFKPLWGESHTGPVVSNSGKVDSIVLSHKKRGYDLIKLYERLSKDVYLEFLDAAFKHNIKVASHIPYSLFKEMDVDEILNSKSPSFEHFSNFGALVTKQEVKVVQQPNDFAYYGKELAADPDLDKIKAIVMEIKRNQIWICPTSVLWRNSDSLQTEEIISGNRFSKLDDGLKNWWLSTRSTSNNGNKKIFAEKFLMEMAKQNVKVLAGTDFPNPFLIPGYSLHQEIHSLVQMGYSNLEALKSATVYPNQYWQEEKMRGIKSGGVANLVILYENPLDDIVNTLTIEKVIFKGKTYYPENLLQ